MLQIEQAQEILLNSVNAPAKTETVSLKDALRKVLAKDLAAAEDQPPFARSPLDGYALRAKDLEGASKENPVRLKVIGKIFAGEVFKGSVTKNTALCLMTGAPIPDGADTVIRQEDTKEEDGYVYVYVTAKPFDNYCPAGEDYSAGDILLNKGDTLNAGRLAVASSMGFCEISVFKKPLVSVITTGDEVVLPGCDLKKGKIYDSNLAYISLRLEEFEIKPVISKHVNDDAAKMADEIRAAASVSDFIITTGGVSVGEKDIMHDVEKLLKAEHLFWRVDIKPGKPTLAFLYEGTLVLCLSGNPYGAVVNFELLARPVLYKLTGDKNLMICPQKAVLENDFSKAKGKRRFVRGFLQGNSVTVFEHPSGTISTLVMSNCLVEIAPENNGLSAGSEVNVYKF